MYRMIKLLFRGFPLVLMSILLSCAVNPVTGKKEFMLISTEEEISIGRKTDKQVTEQYGIYPDRAIQNYLNEIGQKMVPLTHRPELPYTFKVVDSEIINAFAVPGGYVYFTRGILAYLNDEAELAGVLGHEIGHIAARHSAKQISQARVVQLGFGVGSVVSETFRKYSGLANFGVQLLFLKFSRDHERQSDELGVEYSTKAGYDAHRMAEFFHTLERMQPADGRGLPGWFSTHPNPADRVAAVNRKTREWQANYPGRTFVVNRERYLRKIDGIVFGPDPRQGFVENGVFYHPNLQFQFPIPAQWQVNNLPTQVQMFPQSQEAAILFSLAKEISLQQAANQFLKQAGATVLSTNSIRVNGMKARVLVSQIVSDNQTLQLLSYFIQKKQYVFVFHGVCEKSNYSRYRETFQQTMNGFRRLSDPGKLNKKPDIVRVKRVAKNTTLQKALLEFGVPQKKLEKIALLNGMTLTAPVTKGMLIKTIAKQ